jgi:protein-S-isoprenylcysteine O-methyltransferase Ste14
MFYLLYFEKAGSGRTFEAAGNAVLFISFGVVHSLLARDAAKSYLGRWVGSPFVRIVYVWISGITLSLVLYFWQPLSGTLWQTHGVLSWFLSILFVASIAGLIWTTSFVDYADFLGIRTLLRISRNLPVKPPVFSAKGPYAHCRHPMYIFLMMALWIGPVMTYTAMEFAILASAYLVIGTFFEERSLRKELGEIYDLYRANVPMWLPQLKPWRLE